MYFESKQDYFDSLNKMSISELRLNIMVLTDIKDQDNNVHDLDKAIELSEEVLEKRLSNIAEITNR